ncbi:OLC1v1006370C1 [Oldenlandia corymbosa var. corymbosa]|uniref:OLC1v1006370C1 n=1 Tax=Oldenlandia corymbosa var. corymbosa TaxID=529605 RepID=A0AAV1DHG6_OLDCO|nr:OLC1v1006370C1 [Oldenlandia corymbosa var. corymbosa]
MGNSLRCCLACVLPCGALDLIRIVHLNGFVEEFSGPITAQEVLKDNPHHVLSKPSSQGMAARRIMILSPETELKRGSIYFLIPESSLPEKKKLRSLPKKSSKKVSDSDIDIISTAAGADSSCEKHLTEVKSEKKSSSRRHRRRGSNGVWKPHLESIIED